MLKASDNPPRLTPEDQHVLGEEERLRLLVEWNQTQVDYPRDLCIHQLFESQVERTPHAVAVIEEWHSDAARSLTFQQLNARANQLAHYLQQLGVKPETIVGVSIERSLELVIALLGVLKAGGAYAPLDPDNPAQRLNLMLSDAGAPVLLTLQRLAGDLEAASMNTICLDSEWEIIAQESQENPLCTATPENLAYIIYTSGSTGAPKGAMISHRALCNHMNWMQSAFPIDADDRVLQKTAIGFDASVWEFYAPLLFGARLVMAKPGGHRDPACLVEAIQRNNITILQVVPSVLRMLVEQPGLQDCISLRRLFCGGEALSPDLVERVFAASGVELVNLYGPAEACIDTLYYPIPRGVSFRRIPIGRPVANTRAYILDNQFHPLPMGKVGELYLAGDSVGRGYLDRPKLTAERFLPDPFNNSSGRLYRTGDLARYRPDGNIEYLGRVDSQVKILGSRVELGEVESALGEHVAIQQAVVRLCDGPSGEKLLAAYVVCRPKQIPSSGELRDFLKTRLPEYMLPGAFVFLSALPFTPNGKIDCLALPEPEIGDHSIDLAISPQGTAFEQVLLQICAEVLGVERVGMQDNFFDLGGHSLLAFRLIYRIEERFNTDISLVLLFEMPTLGDFAAAILENAPGRDHFEKVARSWLDSKAAQDEIE